MSKREIKSSKKSSLLYVGVTPHEPNILGEEEKEKGNRKEQNDEKERKRRDR